MSTQETSADPLVQALQRKVNHQADRIDELETELEELRTLVKSNSMMIANREEQ